MMESVRFSAGALRSRLQGGWIGANLHCLPEVDSTNRMALALARDGAPEGTVVLADSQTRGRGRLERVWQSPPGCNLYTSSLLRPALAPAEIPRITLLAGVALAETVAAYCPAGVGLKWPNDVRVRGRKVGGILTEMRMEGPAVAALVVGIGLNVNMAAADFDLTHRRSATSLREETGGTVCRTAVALGLLSTFAVWYERFRGDGFSPVRQAWLARSEMNGRFVRIRFGDCLEEGRVTGIDEDGALLIRTENGDLRRVTAGDATLLKDECSGDANGG
jgi:BirA family transcriptional regulator, biotin operon repressor / biotin---[acetyl-CoA-carboxylase] ligase